MLRVVGAGLPRTGTYSLRLALQQLLGSPCYHMVAVLQQPEVHAPFWRDAALGYAPDWEKFLAEYSAAVDFPASAFWSELSEAYPDAVVLLSSRSSPQKWLESVEATLGETARAMRDDPAMVGSPLGAMMAAMGENRLVPHLFDPDGAIAAYERHNDEVRSAVDPERLVEWQPGDGWEPICKALGVAVPNEPFPHENSRDDFVGNNYAPFTEGTE